MSSSLAVNASLHPGSCNYSTSSIGDDGAYDPDTDLIPQGWQMEHDPTAMSHMNTGMDVPNIPSEMDMSDDLNPILERIPLYDDEDQQLPGPATPPNIGTMSVGILPAMPTMSSPSFAAHDQGSHLLMERYFSSPSSGGNTSMSWSDNHTPLSTLLALEQRSQQMMHSYMRNTSTNDSTGVLRPATQTTLPTAHPDQPFTHQSFPHLVHQPVPLDPSPFAATPTTDPVNTRHRRLPSFSLQSPTPPPPPQVHQSRRQCVSPLLLLS